MNNIKNIIKEEKYKKYIINVADNLFPQQRKRQFTSEYYLNKFLLVLDDVTKWKSLNKTEGFSDKTSFHYKTIENKFNLWSKYNVFGKAYSNFLNEHYFTNIKSSKTKKINTFTDVTCISNKLGRQNVGVHPELHKKNTTKIASLIDENKVLLSITSANIYETEETLNNKTFTKKTIEHDIKTVQPLFDNLLLNVPKHINFESSGDKAYSTQEKFKINGKEIKIITSKRQRSEKQTKKMIKKKEEKLLKLKNKNKNKEKINEKITKLNEEIQKLKNPVKIKYTKKEKYMLGKRYLVEIYFRGIKKYDRIMIRKDHNINTFLSFIYLANLIELSKKY